MYLFDTDTLSNIVKRKPSGILLGKLRDLPRAFQYTSTINVGEIYYGAIRSLKKRTNSEGI
jgi:predicted nucleic acid-binding protein